MPWAQTRASSGSASHSLTSWPLRSRWFPVKNSLPAATTPSMARTFASRSSVMRGPDSFTAAPTSCQTAARAPWETVPNRPTPATATAAPSTTAMAGTPPAVGARSARVAPRNPVSPGPRRNHRTNPVRGSG